MTLQSRVTALAQAVGADVKTINTKLNTVAASFRQMAVSSPGAAVNWRTIPIHATNEITPAGAFTRNADGSVTIRDAGWYNVSAVFRNAAVTATNATMALTDTPGDVGNHFCLNTEDFGGLYSGSASASAYFAAGAKVYANVWTNISVAIELTRFTIVRVGGPKGDKGDAGGIEVLTTLDWDEALESGFYRSVVQDLEGATVNGPGNQMNPPPQAGIVSVSETGHIVQRVWDLHYQRGYTRYRRFDDEPFSDWVPDVVKPWVVPEASVGGLAPEDGEERYYQNAEMKAAGVIWKFRYDATGTAPKKWVFVGGGSIVESLTNDTTRAVSTYGDLASGAMAIHTLALPGDYIIEIGASLTPGSVGNGIFASFSVNGATALDSDAAVLYSGSTTPVGLATVSFVAKKVNLASFTTIQAKFKAQGAIAGGVGKRYISITPIRVNM